MTHPPKPAQIRLERKLDRLRIGDHRRLKHHLALVVDHANCGFVHAHVQSSEEFHRSPPALLKAGILRWDPPAGHLASRRHPQVRPITGGIPNRACKVDSQLRYFQLFTHEYFLSLCTDCGQSPPVDAHAVAFSRRGPCIPSAFGTWPSHALHQVHKRGCPSSLALSSRGTEAGKR